MSLTAKFINILLKVLKFNKMFLDIEDSNGDRTKFKQIVLNARAKEDCKSPPGNLFKQCVKSEFSTDGHTTHLLNNKKSDVKKIIVYFHGGAYVKGPLLLQWKTLAEIADTVNYDIAVVDYPKIPEYTCKEAIEFCVQVYEKLIMTYNQSDIIFFGDSAGGGLALSVFMSLRDSGKATPGKMILMSPWLDVSMTNEEITEYTEKDLILTSEGLVICGQFYAGDIDTKDWRVSPMYGDISGLPETHVFVGGSELFYPDCRDFVLKASEIGCNIKLHFYDNMQHDWPIIPMIPEAVQARCEIIEILQA